MSTTLFELEGLTAGTQYDRIDVSAGVATLTAGATLDIDFFGIFAAGLGDIFDVIVADDIVADLNTLAFDFTDALLAAGQVWTASLFTFSGGLNDGREALRLSVVTEESLTIAEPSSVVLLLSGLFGLIRLRRMNRAS